MRESLEDSYFVTLLVLGFILILYFAFMLFTMDTGCPEGRYQVETENYVGCFTPEQQQFLEKEK